jgi:hypothetical protein
MPVLALPVVERIDNSNITERVTDPSGGVSYGANATVTQMD